MDQHGQRHGRENLIVYEKGQSGNPNGRPKGSKNRKALAKKWMTMLETVTNPITKETEQLSQEDLCFLSMIAAARFKKDTKAFELIMDARFGKVADKKEKEPVKPSDQAYDPFTIVDPANADEVISIEIGAAK